jgi:hypothetical protein
VCPWRVYSCAGAASNPNPGHVVEKQTDNLVDCDFTHSELLDVTLAYLKGKDAEEAQEHANSSSLALYA